MVWPTPPSIAMAGTYGILHVCMHKELGGRVKRILSPGLIGSSPSVRYKASLATVCLLIHLILLLSVT